MDFIQFKEELKAILTIRFEEMKGKLNIETVQKNGGPKTGFIFMPDHGQMGITFYAEDAYRNYQNGREIGVVVESIMQVIKEQSKELKASVDIKELLRPENIIPALVPSKGNEELLKSVPHVPFENLQIIFKFTVSNLEGAQGTINVSNQYMEEQGWNEEKLLEVAMNNSKYKDEIEVIPLQNIAFDTLSGADEEELRNVKESDNPMVVITNSSRYYGAAAILDKEVMLKVSDTFNEDLYIIPSSIHECIVVPKSSNPIEMLQEMVYEVNRSEVYPEDRLSDDIYLFDSFAKEITLASGQRERTELVESVETQRR